MEFSNNSQSTDSQRATSQSNSYVSSDSSESFANSSNILASTILPSHYHLSKFKTDVKPQDIIRYVFDKSEQIVGDIRVIRLTKRTQDVSQLNFINFKIETTNEIGELLCANDFWPKFCKITQFKRKSNGGQSHVSPVVSLDSLSQNFHRDRTTTHTK